MLHSKFFESASKEQPNKHNQNTRLLMSYSLIKYFLTLWNNTWAYELCHRTYVHTLQVCILLTVYRTQLFKQLRQIAHSKSYLWINILGTQNCVRWCVFVFVCQLLNNKMLCSNRDWGR